MMRRTIGLAAVLFSATANAQVLEGARGPVRNALLIEAELVGGYTPVELKRWTRTVPTTSNHLTYGANVRAYLFFINDTRIGLEFGNQHFFTWERHTPTGSTIIKDINTVAGYRFGFVVQVCDEVRIDCDMGYGFHFLGEDVLPGGHFGLNYLLLNRRRFKLPIGARLDLILGEQATAMPVALKTGFSFKT